MRYIINHSHKPDYNIALETYCFKHLKQFDKILILWINEPTIVVGKHQNTLEEINAEYVKKNNINVVRRISGGGAVYHDLNNLNYTIISNEDKGSAFDFKTFSQPVIETLRELGVKANFTGRNDIEIEGNKICGTAQAYITGRIMHHGCLLFDTDLSVLSKALNASKDIIASKSVKSVRSKVDNVFPHLAEKITIHEFADKILENIKQQLPEMEEYFFTDEEKEKIEALRKGQFSTWEWIYGNSPDFNIERSRRFTAGKIQVFADIQNATIQQIKFYGTFFGNNSDLTPIEEVLQGVTYTAESVRTALQNVEDIQQYFAGFSLDELVEAIVEL